jgi:multicomponent Na+:H+ antiporter subunit E
MSPGALLAVLAIGWLAVTGGFTLPNLLLGLLVAGLVLLLFRHRFARVRAPSVFLRSMGLAFFFLKELLLSALAVARLAATPDLGRRLKPAIVAFPLQLESDAEITLLANLITLTPGTLSLDISPDRRQLFIHVLALADRERLLGDIASGFERRIAEIFDDR